MDVYSAIQRRRSIRRYRQQKVSESLLFKLVDAARLAPSAGNLQPLEYITVTDPETCETIFGSMKWARNIPGGDEPPEGKRPAAYIIVLINREILPRGGGHDVGAAVQNILLEAVEAGIGSCWIRTFNQETVRKSLKIPDTRDADSVIAFGYPAEAPVTEPLKTKLEYWRDDRGLMHVPKRKLDKILHRGKF